MKPARFDYIAPSTVADAAALLADMGEEAAVLAGGMTLGPMLNLRMVRPRAVIDISRIAQLQRIETRDGALVTGATVIQSDALRAPQVLRDVPLLALALPYVGHEQTRNRGTLGGSVAHADPSAEIPLCLVTLGGSVVLRAGRRERPVPANKFFLGTLTTARRPDELVVALEWPRSQSDAGHAFAEIAQRHGDFAICAAACALRLDDGGRLAQLALGIGGVDDHPVALDTAPFLGRLPDAALAADLAALAQRSVRAMEDHVADATYRLALARHLMGQVLTDAAADARARNTLPTSPRKRGEVGSRSDPGEGASRGVAVSATALHPNPPPASGESGRTQSGERANVPSQQTSRRLFADQRHRVSLTVNGAPRHGEAEPRMMLTDFLRHELQLTGVHVGCEHGMCGACTIIRDGRAVRACTQYAVQAEGAAITTVEGLAEGGTLNALQRAFRRHHALQCGYCTPGILMSATMFLRETPQPTDRQVREMLCGHICRCTGYQAIVDAIMSAAKEPG
jgi:xanthine dehydrogenase iron-sulfur cluster and FAD-binding subunit A